MASHKLPILTLAVKSQQYSCHGCGNCCRDFTVQLREDDLRKLEAQGWEEKLGMPVTMKFRGVRYLRQREDGGCVFLKEDGRCRIHAELGFGAKPIACQLFPFSLTPVEGRIALGLNFACQSVQENRGAALESHARDLKRLGKLLPEIAPAERPPMLTRKLRATGEEVKALVDHIEKWLIRDELDLMTRLDGLAFVVESLSRAKLENVRGERFGELLDVLFGALPEELAFHPVSRPSSGQTKLLRQAVFTRIEDPKLDGIETRGRLGIIKDQLRRSHRFKMGRGSSPPICEGWPEGIEMSSVKSIRAAEDETTIRGIDDLMTRYLRITILGGRAWGAGYYAWPVIEGLQAMLLNVAVIGWLARLHAAGRGLEAIDLEAVRAALGRVDRTSGRALWLGSPAERVRLSYLKIDDGFRKLLGSWKFQERDQDRDDGHDHHHVPE